MSTLQDPAVGYLETLSRPHVQSQLEIRHSAIGISEHATEERLRNG
jgi:hypothetical protein